MWKKYVTYTLLLYSTALGNIPQATDSVVFSFQYHREFIGQHDCVNQTSIVLLVEWRTNPFLHRSFVIKLTLQILDLLN